MDTSESATPQKLKPLQKPHLSFISLTALVVAGMIGSGIYSTTGYALADLQSPQLVLLAWCVAGFIAVCGAISYGELANRILESGGEYLYLTRFVHPFAGFLAGWVSALAGFTGAAALAAKTFEIYALQDQLLFGWMPPGSLAVGLIVLLTIFHAIGIRVGSISQNMVVVVKLTAIAVLIGWVFWLWPEWFVNHQTSDVQIPTLQDLSISHEQVSSPASTVHQFSWLVFATSTMWISFSFTGFNSAIYVAEESATGVSGIRRSMIFGTVIVTVLYLLLNIIFLYAADPAVTTGKPNIAVLCVQEFHSDVLPGLLKIAICLGLASSVSSMLMMGPRVYRKMAQDGVFPAAVVSTGTHFRFALVLQGMAMIVVALIAELQDLLTYLSMTLSLCSAGTVATLLFCRRDTDGNLFAKTSVLVGLATWIYFIATIVIVALSGYGNPAKFLGTLVTVVTGTIVFRVLKPQKHSTSSQSTTGIR